MVETGQDKLLVNNEISSCHRMFLSGLAYYMYTTTANQIMLLGNPLELESSQSKIPIRLNQIIPKD